VSLIQSNYQAFGSGIVAAGTGFALHDRGGLFSMDATHQMRWREEEAAAHNHSGIRAKGEMCVWRSGSWAAGINRRRTRSSLRTIVDFKMNIQAALEAPRFSKHTFSGCDVMMENRFGQNVRNELTSKGTRST